MDVTCVCAAAFCAASALVAAVVSCARSRAPPKCYAHALAALEAARGEWFVGRVLEGELAVAGYDPGAVVDESDTTRDSSTEGEEPAPPPQAARSTKKRKVLRHKPPSKERDVPRR